MALGPIAILPNPGSLAGFLIIAALVYYGGSSLLEDLGRAVGVTPRDAGQPLISLPAAAVILGIGLFAFGTRR